MAEDEEEAPEEEEGHTKAVGCIQTQLIYARQPYTLTAFDYVVPKYSTKRNTT